MAFKPTQAQESAIKEKGNILVSAAAGSGKTAVLVERVIISLCSKENPVRADKLLIVTFTNAAAAEMRARIEKRLDEEYRKSQNDPAILLQKHLLNNAKICTIDAFCIELVRENFEKLNISPDFKIGDAATLETINQRVLSRIVNRYFEQNNPLFFQLLDLAGGEYDEKNFLELLWNVYEYSRQLPFPDKWYNEILKQYNNGVFSKDNVWYKYAFGVAQKTVKSMKKQIANAVDLITTVPDAANAYLKVFGDAAQQITLLEESADTGDWDTFYAQLQTYKLMRLPSVRGLGDLQLISAAKDIYKYLGSKSVDRLNKLFYADFEFVNNQFSKLYPLLELFIIILKEFEDELFKEYLQENIFTFHNTEHLALKLLCCEKDDTISVSEYGRELLGQFNEVLVDEYQDTNDLQDMLFYVLSDFEKNLFVVGDVKQSIYAFRGANPQNFLNKKERYVLLDESKNTDPKKIILSNNFRSKDQVCDFVNFFFKLFMQKETGNIIYNSEEELFSSAQYPQLDENAVSVDIIDSGDSDDNSLTLEARQIARYIKKTINSNECIRVDEKTLRKANYGDFTILMRSISNKAPQLVAELKKQGIPVNLNVSNFAESVEVKTFLSLLKVIDNPQGDVELLTVLMSPIFGFTPDEMAEIRSYKKDGNLYSSLIFAAKNSNQRCESFLKTLELMRLDAATLSPAALIAKLMVNTEYLNIVSAAEDGEQRKNNLLLLCDLAEQFSSENMFTLSAFIKYIENQAQNLSCAGSVSKDCVNIMSIHASKGLQFPVCIIAATASRFRDGDTINPASYSTDYGLGFKYFDEDLHQKTSTISREVIMDNEKFSSMEEELRLFYVAMTRAQDKLHFVSCYNNFEKSLDSYKNILLSSDCSVDNSLFLRTKSYADWLILALLLHPQSKKNLDKSAVIIPIDTVSSVDVNIIEADALMQHATEDNFSKPFVDEGCVAVIRENFDYKYPYSDLNKIQSKISVSALANKAESEKFSFTAQPGFMSHNGMSASARGTAMHKVMQYFDFNNWSDIKSELERLYEWQFISREEYDSISIDKLEAFFNSEIFKRIIDSPHIEREMRFITELSAQKIDNTLNTGAADEKIIVQGAVDICFIENGEVVIVDFKTDRVEDIAELGSAYGEQLSIYAMACEKIFNTKVKEKIIYSFNKSDMITIK